LKVSKLSYDKCGENQKKLLVNFPSCKQNENKV
jgi:hypothetical protein